MIMPARITAMTSHTRQATVRLRGASLWPRNAWAISRSRSWRWLSMSMTLLQCSMVFSYVNFAPEKSTSVSNNWMSGGNFINIVNLNLDLSTGNLHFLEKLVDIV
jgi:hypothetical protein